MIENVPEIPCLFDRHKQCPEFLCPLQPKNERHILKVLWKIRSREWGGLRNAFQRHGIDITGEMICDLLFNPDGYTKRNGSAVFGTRFTAEQKKFGLYIANLRQKWIEENDNHWDAYKIRCLVKRERLLSHE